MDCLSDCITIPNKFGNYDFKRIIGKGGFAVVAKCYDRVKQRYVAVKFVARKSLANEAVFARFECELRMLERINHPNIVKIYEVLYFPDSIGIVMEHCPNGVLYEYIASNGCLTDLETIRLSTQILSALTYLHERQIVHRDIKPENIALDIHNNAKLIDFGLAKQATDLSQTICGSSYYVAPEVINSHQYDAAAADMWSFGMIVHMMATGTLPWNDLPPAKIIDQMKKGQVKLNIMFCGVATVFVEKTLLLNPSERATAAELLKIAQCFHLPKDTSSESENQDMYKPASLIYDHPRMLKQTEHLKIRKNPKIVQPNRLTLNRRSSSTYSYKTLL